MKPKLIIYWCRRDFRLTDNPALTKSIEKYKATGAEFLPMFVLDTGILNSPSVNVGYPRRLFLSKVLAHFAYKFDNLVIFESDYKTVFAALAERFDLEVFANDDIEPYSIIRDQEVSKLVPKFTILSDQISVNRNIVSGTGNIYSVFSPFKRAVWNEFLSRQPLPQVTDIPSTSKLWQQTRLQTLEYVKTETQLQQLIFQKIDQPWIFQVADMQPINLDNILERPSYDEWNYTEESVQNQFDQFLTSGKMAAYKDNRDDMGQDTVDGGQTSRMSVGLKWGLVSTRQLKQKILDHFGTDFENPLSTRNNEGGSHFISELIWREFYKYILLHHNYLLDTEFQTKYRGTIQWLDDRYAMERFVKWIKGETGYPAVDAAMNQIAKSGWMHNRARMMVASILTKNLGVNWRWGQEYFRAVLLDLDESANNGGWQWASSTGSDPKPIRIFNPYLQAQNYDKKNLYQQKWLPSDYNADQNLIIEHPKAREEAMRRYGLGGSKEMPRDY
jgi:deoxyribodipyrimidine photo-lyase